MKLTDTAYKVLYHFRGYIRIELSTTDIRSWARFLKYLNKPRSFRGEHGIKNFYFNQFTGNMVITYRPEDINILECITKWFQNGLSDSMSKDEYHEVSASH